jgi:hypothetical protein
MARAGEQKKERANRGHLRYSPQLILVGQLGDCEIDIGKLRFLGRQDGITDQKSLQRTSATKSAQSGILIATQSARGGHLPLKIAAVQGDLQNPIPFVAVPCCNPHCKSRRSP